MTNVEMSTKGDKLILTIDLSKATIAAAQPSSTGKNRIVASTSGLLPIAGPAGVIALRLGLNVICK